MEKKEKWYISNGLVIAFLFVLLAWGVNFGTAYLLFQNCSKPNEYGDSFGAVNALFSGVGSAFLVYSILQQKEQIKQQQEEIHLLNQQLGQQNTAIGQQNKALELQTEQIRQQNEALNLQRDELKLQRQESENQTQELKRQANELEHNRQQTQYSIFLQGLYERINFFENFKMNATESLSRRQSPMPFRTFIQQACLLIEGLIEDRDDILREVIANENPKANREEYKDKIETGIIKYVYEKFNFKINKDSDLLPLSIDILYSTKVEDKMYYFYQYINETFEIYVKKYYSVIVYINQAGEAVGNLNAYEENYNEFQNSLTRYECNLLLYFSLISKSGDIDSVNKALFKSVLSSFAVLHNCELTVNQIPSLILRQAVLELLEEAKKNQS